MIYQARTLANELFIAMYETEKPKAVDHPPAQYSYKKALEHWQSSKREYKVRESDRKEILDAILEHWLYPWDMKDFYRELCKGIDCTFLKDRLKLTCKHCDNRPEHCSKLPSCGEFEWTLLPLEDKKENEAVEFAEWLVKNDCHKEVSPLTDDPITWDYNFKVYTTKELYQIFKNPNKQ